VLTLVGSLCYAELASTFPIAGGDYHFLRGLSPRRQLFFGWAARRRRDHDRTDRGARVHLRRLRSRILPLGSASSRIYAALVVALLTALNIFGLKESSRTQNVITLLLIAGMVLVAFGGFRTPAVPSPAATAQLPISSPLAGPGAGVRAVHLRRLERGRLHFGRAARRPAVRS